MDFISEKNRKLRVSVCRESHFEDHLIDAAPGCRRSASFHTHPKRLRLVPPRAGLSYAHGDGQHSLPPEYGGVSMLKNKILSIRKDTSIPLSSSSFPHAFVPVPSNFLVLQILPFPLTIPSGIHPGPAVLHQLSSQVRAVLELITPIASLVLSLS